MVDHGERFAPAPPHVPTSTAALAAMVDFVIGSVNQQNWWLRDSRTWSWIAYVASTTEPCGAGAWDVAGASPHNSASTTADQLRQRAEAVKAGPELQFGDTAKRLP